AGVVGSYSLLHMIPAEANTARQANQLSWERMKQCAERADHLARQQGWVVGRSDGGTRVLGWSNHFSPKYQRCYVEVSYFNDAAESDESLPVLTYSLFDAFENKELSSCTDASNLKAGSFCEIFAGEAATPIAGDCRECRAFVQDRMGK